MTREEAVRQLTINRPSAYTELREAISMAIKALEQENVLDKIKAEIESIERYSTNNGHDVWLRTPEEIKKDALTIINKYKVESEE